ncbi:MAG: NAD(P)/FAD-dependent oxidoreductase [Pseudomonadota bacterium]
MSDLKDHVFDVLIIGAGISGIGCACHLKRELPGKTFAILEARADLGGTWDLFKYPGIRSDSDLHTFSYEFKPWSNPNSIASGEEIMAYLRETVEEYGLDQDINYNHKVVAANWDSQVSRWSLVLETPNGRVSVQCRWLFSATGYYDYEQGFRPDFKNENAFRGPLIHPQHWPENFDYADKKIAVIGSGATAVTLVPAMAKTAKHVTQIQRTPTYILSRPSQDKLAKRLHSWLPAKWAHALTRWKNTRLQRYFFLFCQRFPQRARNLIRKANEKMLPADYPVDVHFNPPYNPWDQRLCAVPDGDLFRSLRSGEASIVTGHIDQFESNGVRLRNGELVEADAIIIATGLKVKMLGGISITMDGVPVSVTDSFVFRGMMLSDVPNYAFAIGYTNSSWTLKVDIICKYLCNLIKEMDAQGKEICVANRPSEGMEARPLLDFQAGYVKRALHELPKQGPAYPWEMTLDYMADRRSLRDKPVLDPALTLSDSMVPVPNLEVA